MLFSIKLVVLANVGKIKPAAIDKGMLERKNVCTLFAVIKM